MFQTHSHRQGSIEFVNPVLLMKKGGGDGHADNRRRQTDVGGTSRATELSIDFVRLANLLKGWTHDTCVIQFCFRDIRDRIYCSKRFLVMISSLEKYLQPSIWIRDEVPN